YKRQFGARVSMLIDKLVEIAMLRLQGERLADIVLTAPEGAADAADARGEGSDAAAAASGRAVACASSAALELRGVRFRYAPHEPWVLDGLDLAVAAGDSVAIVGPSGCGKSTLVHVLLGMLEPEAGDLRVDGF